MDITFQVYNALGMMTTPRPDIYIDEDAEAARPKPQPLREPKPIYNLDVVEKDAPLKSPDSHPAFEIDNDLAEAKKRKHESYNLSGSVFLVTGDGRTLKLPIPSESRHDPLNWGRWKTTGAMFALGLYSIVCLTAVQAASLMMHGILEDFREAVCSLPHTQLTAPAVSLSNYPCWLTMILQDFKPWTPETLVTAPTLFMGIGALIWVPLSLALGRRPTFLISALFNLAATIGAGYAKTFHQLLLFLCVLGVGEGFALTPVCSPQSPQILRLIDQGFSHRNRHDLH